jgi:arsenite methyltransferase
MANQQSPSYGSATTSTGHDAASASWLDTHFETFKPEYQAMVRWVGIETGWHVLDAGCGSGGFIPVLAELVGSKGHISALDLAPENIDVVNARIEVEQFASPVDTRLGNVTSLPYQDDSFDAAWCANTTQYLTDGELRKALEDFRRVVKPGGLVAIKEFDGTGLQFYPFDPVQIWHLLELRRQKKVQARGALRPVALPTWLKEAGLMDVRYETTVGERRAPLRPVERQFIGSVLQYFASEAERFGMPEPELSVWRQLSDVNSPDHIMNHRDFYWRECHATVTGRVPKP